MARTPFEERGNHPFGEGSVGFAGNPRIHRPAPIRLDAHDAGPCSDQDQLRYPAVQARREILCGDAPHRVADHDDPVEPQRVGEGFDGLRQAARSRKFLPAGPRAERIEIERKGFIFRQSFHGTVPEPNAAEPWMEHDDGIQPILGGGFAVFIFEDCGLDRDRV